MSSPTTATAKPVSELSPQPAETVDTARIESSLDQKMLIPTNDSRPTVDALLSPTAETPTNATPSSTDEPEPETDENIDENRFSTVSLSAAPLEPSASGHPNANRSSVSSTTNMEISLVTPRTSMSLTLASTGSMKDATAKDKSKRRPSSLIVLEPKSATSSSTPNADFILAKLEKDLMSPTKSIRTSLDAKHILQAEFEQVRNAQKEDDMESVTADGINWGPWI
jgi:ecotropic viral integration site 5 protein